MAEFYTLVTNIGIEQLTDCINNTIPFNPVKMAVGDSNGSYYEPELTQTSLKNQKFIDNIFAKGKKDNYLYFDMQIPPSVGDFTIREVGLFDIDNNLLAVAKYPETLKQRATGGSNKYINIELQIELSNSAINTIIIDDSGNLVTREIFDEYRELNEKGKANTNLSNLSSEGEKHFLNKTQITNCILESPQHIITEFISGTANGIIIKAGSKAYKPDGTYYILNRDYPIESPVANQLVCFSNTFDYAGGTSISNTYYGANPPANPGAHAYWWDTTNNVVKRYIDSQWVDGGFSLPLVYFDSNKKPHVNNTAGFIGNCQFFLPGIKYLVPNGRNSDGSLNNIEYTTSFIIKNIYEYQPSALQGVLLHNNSSALRYGRYYEGKDEPESISAMCWFNTEQNLMKYCSDAGTWIKISAARIITFIATDVSPFTVKNMEVKDSFRSVDYNDFNNQVEIVTNNLNKYLPLAGGKLTGVAYGVASAAVNSLLTTGEIKKAATGYLKLGNGIILQWGVTSSISAYGKIRVTLPKAFSNTTYFAIADSLGRENCEDNMNIKSKATSSFEIYATESGGGGYIAAPAMWFAIGY